MVDIGQRNRAGVTSTASYNSFIPNRYLKDQMNQRRQVLFGLTCTATGAALGVKNVLSLSWYSNQQDFKSARPAPAQRKFVSEAVEAKIVEVKRTIADPDWPGSSRTAFPIRS